MDAASNNSVDDIRELRESVAFAPVSGRSKVYILDEAHMLSTAAWNAFLKTLEEPPPHTIFVLATTEAGKVLPTVVDRCHRFDSTARPSSRSPRCSNASPRRRASRPSRACSR
jgi:DNA polymerase-3 subunit gamma/tau